MKNLQNYDIFSEKYRLNENLLKKTWGKIRDFFTKKFKESWIYYLLFLKKTGNLPKFLKIIVPDSIKLDKIPNESDVETVKESFTSTKEFIKGKNVSFSNVNVSNVNVSKLYEAEVNLHSSDPNIPDVDVPKLMKAIKDVWKMNEFRAARKLPRTDNNALFIWGAPGIGKTSILKQVANELNCFVCVWLLSQTMPEDIKGVPVVRNIGTTGNPEDERTIFKLPRDFPPSDSDTRGILFFDEMNQANKAVLGAAMTLCLDGSIGEYKLPEHWIVIAAGNRPEDVGAGGMVVPLSKPLASRFAHVNYAPKFDDWLNHMIDNEYMNPDVLAFLQFDKSYFFKMDSDEETNLFPNPRNWEKASFNDYVNNRDADWHNKASYDEILSTYGRQVGMACARAFVEFLKIREIYSEKDIKAVYELGSKARVPKVRLDQQFAINSAIAYYKRGEKITPKELQNVYDFTLTLPDTESKTSLLNLFNFAHKADLKSDPALSKIYWDTIKKWHKELTKLEFDENAPEYK